MTLSIFGELTKRVEPFSYPDPVAKLFNPDPDSDNHVEPWKFISTIKVWSNVPTDRNLYIRNIGYRSSCDYQARYCTLDNVLEFSEFDCIYLPGQNSNGDSIIKLYTWHRPNWGEYFPQYYLPTSEW
jgi:hypothetical protein